ncbi:hypothetical protein [Fibrobacter sp.]|uniref:hypothetical protein n=1 Tax=Fibrobacter sp. TaxID=35828 RepID=UPI00388F2E73
MILRGNEKSLEFHLDLSVFERALIETFNEHQPQPIRAVEKTLKKILYEEVTRNCKSFDNFISASITIHEFYNKINHSLAYLSKHGLTFWYTVIETKWKKPSDFLIINANVKGIKLGFSQYADGKKVYQNNYAYDKKKHIIIKTQLNEIIITSEVFSRVLSATKEKQNYLIYTGFEYFQDINYTFVLPHYYRNVDNKLFVCACTKKAFEESQVTGFKRPKPTFEENICHFCMSKSLDRNALIELYGGEFLTVNGPFVTKLVADGYKHRTALAEFSRIFKTSKWKNEAELYAITKILFPSFTIIREHNPKELKGLRIDIFIQELNLAIEYQGQQHFEPVKAFGGEEAFKKLKERDALKKQLCKELGIELKYFTYKEKLSIELVESKLKKFLSFCKKSDIIFPTPGK